MRTGSKWPLARLISLALAGLSFEGAPVRGDGGTLRSWRQHGNADIAIFTEPFPFVSGPVDISVLLLDRQTGEPIRDARIALEIAPVSQPSTRIRHRASQQAATNKLFHAASFDLAFAGKCNVTVEIEWPGDQAQIPLVLDVGTAWSPRTGVWPWICWPVAPIVAYMIHLRLVHTHGKRPR